MLSKITNKEYFFGPNHEAMREPRGESADSSSFFASRNKKIIYSDRIGIFYKSFYKTIDRLGISWYIVGGVVAALISTGFMFKLHHIVYF